MPDLNADAEKEIAKLAARLGLDADEKEDLREAMRFAYADSERIVRGNHLLAGSIGPLFDAGWAKALEACGNAIKDRQK